MYYFYGWYLRHASVYFIHFIDVNIRCDTEEERPRRKKKENEKSTVVFGIRFA